MNITEAIVQAEKEAANQLAKANNLRYLFAIFPDIKEYVGRWEKRVWYSQAVNKLVENVDILHSCGCCSGSPLEAWPYIRTKYGKVYSDPPQFLIGEESDYGGDRSCSNWKEQLENAEISEKVIKIIYDYFEKNLPLEGPERNFDE